MASISIDDLRVAYGRTLALEGITAEFAEGRMTALAGANGCGKSTLLKAIMGFMPALSGSIRLGDQAISAIGRKALAKRIAYLPQECHCPDYMTLGELVELSGHARYSLFGGPQESDRVLFANALEAVGLADKAHCMVNSLSGGQRQRAWIAMVLAQDTDIVLLDEPVNHLDMKYQYAVLDLIRAMTERQGKTVVIVLHDINLASAFADDIVLLKQGRIIQAGPVTEKVTPEAIASVFDIETDVFMHEGRRVCLPRVTAAEPLRP
jgi:iron complex transport system ATP-binding protein